MSWLDRLARELAARGLTGGDRRRIILELDDHIACEPGVEARLGDPVELAATFADELATSTARRSAYVVFAALVTAAVALIVPQLAPGTASNIFPGFTSGLSLWLFFPALLGMYVAPQVALVAGTLAAWRAVRHRRDLVRPAAELALVRRRAWIALGAGLATVAGIELYVLDFVAVLPAWWLVLTGGLGAVAACALLFAGKELASAGELRSGTTGPAGDVFDDLPIIHYSWLRRHPWALGALGSMLVGLAMTLFMAHAERSVTEGLQRGVFEALAAAVGFVLLGRKIGVPGSPRLAIQSGAGLARIPAERLAGDEDRSRVEQVLREGFGQGRLTLEQLTARLEVAHGARTIGELRQTLKGLPPDER